MMNNNAIPHGSLRKHTWIALVLLCLTLLAGCGKKQLSGVVALQESGKPITQGAAPVPGEGSSGRNTILQMPFDNVAKLVLLNIGQAYKMAMVTNNRPPKNAAELDAGVMKTKRDMQDHEVEVVYGVNPAKLDNPGEYMIAWEKEPTNDGYRMVMMADFTTIKYISTAEFEKTKRAK